MLLAFADAQGRLSPSLVSLSLSRQLALSMLHPLSLSLDRGTRDARSSRTVSAACRDAWVAGRTGSAGYGSGGSNSQLRIRRLLKTRSRSRGERLGFEARRDLKTADGGFGGCGSTSVARHAWSVTPTKVSTKVRKIVGALPELEDSSACCPTTASARSS